jgi:hypothetical protein
MGNEWATLDTIDTHDKDLHINGTIRTSKGTRFWLTAPRPDEYTIDEWEKIQQEKWDRIFKR